MHQYLNLVQNVLNHGTRKQNRTGIDTIGLFGQFYKHDMADGFPLLTTKSVKWEHIVLENLWFLSGDFDISFLRHYNVKFWEPWADEEGKVPSAYGYFHRHFNGDNDQIKYAIDTLRRDPHSRRVVISAWDPSNAQTSKLPPCHVTWVLNTQNDAEGNLRLNLALLQRSCDIALGVPYNLAGYSFLLHLIANLTHLQPGEFAHTLVDAHIYENHIDGMKEQVSRAPRKLPSLSIDSNIKELSDIESIIDSKPSIDDILKVFKLSDYDPHPPIKFEVAV